MRSKLDEIMEDPMLPLPWVAAVGMQEDCSNLRYRWAYIRF